jgi:uncharacterized protein
MVVGAQEGEVMPCRERCAASCIAPSISSAIPGLPCVQLDDQLRCRLFGRPERPAVCVSLQPSAQMCGTSPAQALCWLARLDALTAPGR